jgi:hypothetical protein
MKGFSWPRTLVVALKLASVTVACGGRANPPGPGPDPIGVDPRSTPQIAVLVGAGDIAACGASDRGINAEATAKLLDKVFVEAGTELQHDPTFSVLCH